MQTCKKSLQGVSLVPNTHRQGCSWSLWKFLHVQQMRSCWRRRCNLILMFSKALYTKNILQSQTHLSHLMTEGKLMSCPGLSKRFLHCVFMTQQSRIKCCTGHDRQEAKQVQFNLHGVTLCKKQSLRLCIKNLQSGDLPNLQKQPAPQLWGCNCKITASPEFHPGFCNNQEKLVRGLKRPRGYTGIQQVGGISGVKLTIHVLLPLPSSSFALKWENSSILLAFLFTLVHGNMCNKAQIGKDSFVMSEMYLFKHVNGLWQDVCLWVAANTGLNCMTASSLQGKFERWASLDHLSINQTFREEA